jgi:hypothetical protein
VAETPRTWEFAAEGGGVFQSGLSEGGQDEAAFVQFRLWLDRKVCAPQRSRVRGSKERSDHTRRIRLFLPFCRTALSVPSIVCWSCVLRISQSTKVSGVAERPIDPLSAFVAADVESYLLLTSALALGRWRTRANSVRVSVRKPSNYSKV